MWVLLVSAQKQQLVWFGSLAKSNTLIGDVSVCFALVCKETTTGLVLKSGQIQKAHR